MGEPGWVRAPGGQEGLGLALSVSMQPFQCLWEGLGGMSTHVSETGG